MRSDLPRKTIEPVALAAGTAVRTLQEFLVTARWDRAAAREILRAHLGAVVTDLPADPVGTVGVVDGTSRRKWGDQTPGVQRQYLGCVGKVDNGIVTAHLGAAKGTFHVLLDVPFRRGEVLECVFPPDVHQSLQLARRDRELVVRFVAGFSGQQGHPHRVPVVGTGTLGRGGPRSIDMNHSIE